MAAEIVVRNLELSDPPLIAAAFAKVGWRNKSESKYIGYYAEQTAGVRDVIVALYGDRFAGYGTVVWMPDYPTFRALGIPAIVDLNVLPQFRRRGIASAIMDEAEARIALRSSFAGLGVGLYSDYGPAQRMYVLRGYVPDGKGITYRDEYVTAGAGVIVDDDLVLWLTKRLK